ncbi:MAG: hypothetical protein JW881_07535 [Spirochaetales bacterium]|nr:hypothetical protein [Spirochaetales bacterium]
MRHLIVLLLSLIIFTGCMPYTGDREKPGVYIYSVTAPPISREQITLKNNADNEADISNWKPGDINDPWAYNIPEGTILTAYAKKKFPQSTIGFQINDSDEIIYLRDDSDNIIDTWSN